jgi:hypothetical protein
MIAALATEPPSPPVDLRPVAVGSDRGQASTDSAATVNRQPTVDSRPTATGPVRSQARVNRNALGAGTFPLVRQSRKNNRLPLPLEYVRFRILFFIFFFCVCVCVCARAPTVIYIPDT